ncbi:translation initiation factor 2 [Chthonobacter albigriseus]|uniref:translation initiation factor 2 n=1 Tax=Chthonobacter albigriseus TaxID=1683161 RepID=UPI0019D677E1
MRIEVDPPDSIITTTVGHSCTGIPCKIQVPRKTEFSVTASKEGYTSATVPVISTMAGSGAAGMAGNVILGGFIGVGVDAVSGATLNHSPNPVLIALQPIDPTNPATPAGSLSVLEGRIKAENLEKAAKQSRRQDERNS